MIARRNQRGFTLIETIIAMVVLALVMVLLTGGLRFVTAGWDRGARATDASETIALVQATLRREAAAAGRLTLQGGPKPAVAFRGEADRVGLAVVDPGFPGAPGLAIAIFHVDVAAGVSTLRYARAGFDPRLDDFSAAKTTDDLILAHGPTRFAFDYFGTVPGEAKPRWVSPWPDRQAPPLLIRLRSRDAAGQAPWPDIVVPLPVDLEAACARTAPAAGAQPPEQPDTTGKDAATPPAQPNPPAQNGPANPAANTTAAATPVAGDGDFCSLSVSHDASKPG
ncbi:MULTISPECIES: prepilin-type N-terminal cleavage/methylation domain-containing protein [Inquilinus]|uniref:General secretion pathway protein J n=1 Tax=Inquilinus ginsengisoli TaxID=363840 RepID=A0ABU1JUF4_9PROT|nr:prepilin-type N-terminal cleavage/methylation domain-containing protein [Inquilinus ginsengisoli]MDR6292255.1 general secretion pathway protein J [Inquilinus ginsengisoli]